MKDCGFNFKTTYTTLPDEFFTEPVVDSVPSPKIIVLNNSFARSIGLDFSDLTIAEQAELFSGNQLPIGSTPFSQAYAGHQFGYFSMLGDGRAHTWGEHITPSGLRIDIQFKGSGRTPYSRSGDGKATLGPMLREYIISEALYKLGVPTTRSLAVVKTGESILRETILPGAILTRVASSHIRIGTFEFAAKQLDKKGVELLMNYTIHRHYPSLKESKDKALNLIQAVMEKQAELIVHWMRIGFIHGVMNTDNTTISGETIDYGPCAFMDVYDPNTVFSSIDHMGRYSYVNQSKIIQWNLARLAETLLAFIDSDSNRAIKLAEEKIMQFENIYKNKWIKMMRSKLGMLGSETGDEQIIIDLLDWMHKHNADYTNTFRDLSQLSKPIGKLYEEKIFEEWYLRWRDRIKKNIEPLKSSVSLMKSFNPAVIPRNHQVEFVLEEANRGNLKPFEDFLYVLKEPYIDKEYLKPFQRAPELSERVYQTFCGT